MSQKTRNKEEVYSIFKKLREKYPQETRQALFLKIAGMRKIGLCERTVQRYVLDMEAAEYEPEQ